MVWRVASSGGHIGLLCSSKLVHNGDIYQITESLVIGDIRNIQPKNQHRYLLSDRGWVRISRKGAGEHLVLRPRVHYCY